MGRHMSREGNRTAIEGSSKWGVKTENKSSENISLINISVTFLALMRLNFLLVRGT